MCKGVKTKLGTSTWSTSPHDASADKQLFQFQQQTTSSTNNCFWIFLTMLLLQHLQVCHNNSLHVYSSTYRNIFHYICTCVFKSCAHVHKPLQMNIYTILTRALIRANAVPSSAEPKNIIQNRPAELPSTSAAVALFGPASTDGICWMMVLCVSTQEGREWKGISGSRKRKKVW